MEPKSVSSSRFGRLLHTAALEADGKESYDGVDYDLDSKGSQRSTNSLTTVPEADTCAITAAHAHALDARDEDAARAMQRRFDADDDAQAKLESNDGDFSAKLEIEWKDADLAVSLEAEHAQDEARLHAARRLASRKLERADAKVASRMQDEDDHDTKRSEAHRDAVERSDAVVAATVQRQLERGRHRDRKRREAADADDDVPVVARWAAAESSLELEDVDGCICVSLRLPHLASVTVRASQKRFVLVEAKRNVDARPNAFAAVSPTRASSRANAPAQTAGKDKARALSMKLEMVAAQSCVSQNDLSYDYDAASGYLHVYVDNLRLAALGKADRTGAVVDLRKRLARTFAEKIRLGVKFVYDSHTK
ncbi:hypothetical protein M885DRAFT_536726 [Pelagophyceae sp. CCMP2097]|nr:hypothetical protein M885DRAFT_536726 [Pelagophyceae sp. CCMP2097]